MELPPAIGVEWIMTKTATRATSDDLRDGFRGAAIVWASCALVAFGLVMATHLDTPLDLRAPGVALGSVFGMLSGWCWRESRPTQ
jgi:hypothetical protein